MNTVRPGEHLFVSYAREQSPLVQALGAALPGAGLSAWTDVKGLYGGEEFWPEIVRALEAAAAVVFVISPESAASPHCLRELQHAVNVHKRIVPVCVQEPDAGLIPPGVASVQWIFCRDPGDAARASSEIAAAVAGDWQWLRTGARLLARASEWRDSKSERSRLLHGSELREADRWAATVPSDGSRPTELHLQFFAASHEAERQQLRRRASIAAAGSVSLLAIGLVAWVSWISLLNGRNVAALEKETTGTNTQALDDARSAVAMCRWVPVRTSACDHAGEILGVALQANAQFAPSVEWFSQLIEAVSGRDVESRAPQLLMADLLWHRAVSRIYLAESQPDEPVRRDGYAQARADFDRARQLFGPGSADSADRALNTTAARFAIDAGDYAAAEEALRQESKYAPESSMLRHLVLLCTGRRAESVAPFQSFLDSLVGSADSPVYLRNQPFVTRVRKQCTTQLARSESSLPR